MFGFNSKQVYEDEIRDLNNRRTDIEFDLGDRVRQAYGAVIGKDYSKQGLLDGAAAIRNKQLTDTHQPAADLNATNLLHLTSKFKGVEGKTEAEIKSLLAQDTARAASLQEQISQGNITAGEVDQNATVGQIVAAGTKGAKRVARGERDETREYNRGVVKETREYNRGLLETENLRQDRKDARAELTRAQERKDTLELRRDNMNLEYARLSQADANRAQDRKDKAIMALLGGLGNLGAGFTI